MVNTNGSHISRAIHIAKIWSLIDYAAHDKKSVRTKRNFHSLPHLCLLAAFKVLHSNESLTCIFGSLMY